MNYVRKLLFLVVSSYQTHSWPYDTLFFLSTALCHPKISNLPITESIPPEIYTRNLQFQSLISLVLAVRLTAYEQPSLWHLKPILRLPTQFYPCIPLMNLQYTNTIFYHQSSLKLTFDFPTSAALLGFQVRTKKMKKKRIYKSNRNEKKT